MSDEPGAAVTEWVDVVDDHDRIVRVATRAEMRAGNLRHRATYLVVRSRRGDVLVHRRADHKDVWPGRWDLAVGGVVTAGEEWEAAARRELLEELGVVAPLTELGAGRYRDGDVDVVGRVYEVVHDGPFVFDDGEVVEAAFVSPETLRDLVTSAVFVPDSVALVWPFIDAESPAPPTS